MKTDQNLIEQFHIPLVNDIVPFVKRNKLQHMQRLVRNAIQKYDPNSKQIYDPIQIRSNS